MPDDDVDDVVEVLEAHGLDQGNLEAAVELAKLVCDRYGMCCEALGRFTWRTYEILEGEHGYEQA